MPDPRSLLRLLSSGAPGFEKNIAPLTLEIGTHEQHLDGTTSVTGHGCSESQRIQEIDSVLAACCKECRTLAALPERICEGEPGEPCADGSLNFETMRSSL
jgi:hypothetical protein